MSINERPKFDLELNKVWNCDCLEYMKTVPDNFFDLVLTDPPYGINMDGKIGINGAGKAKEYAQKDWDNKSQIKKYSMK